jgi:hypothetical protein
VPSSTFVTVIIDQYKAVTRADFVIVGFTSKWLLRIIGLPGILCLLCLLYYAYDKRTNPDKVQPKTNLISHAFFAIFFCYPTICIVSFASFICRKLTPEISVLGQDDSVICEDPSHRAIQIASGVIIAVIAFGLPVFFGFILIRAARNYRYDFNVAHETIVARVAKDMDVGTDTAAWCHTTNYHHLRPKSIVLTSTVSQGCPGHHHRP